MTRPHSLDPFTDRCPLIRGVLDRGQQVVAGEVAWCLDEIAALRDALVAAETERDGYQSRLAEIHGQLVDKIGGACRGLGACRAIMGLCPAGTAQ